MRRLSAPGSRLDRGAAGGRGLTDPVAPLVEHLFRREAGRLVATLARRIGVARLDLAEDAVQEALAQALRRWPFSGIPDDPVGWLRRVAHNRALDHLRAESRREDLLARADLAEAAADAPLDTDGLGDDDLRLLLACAHPALSPELAVTLMLKTIGGFGVREIARVFLADPTAVSQRLVRARRTLAQSAEPLVIPPSAEAAASRCALVADALYLMFTLGHHAAEGDAVVRHELCGEALRLARRLAEHPVLGNAGLHALAALFALQGSRLAARADADGIPLLLDQQDVSRWDQGLLALGAAHLERAMQGRALTRWHVEAELAAAHALRVPGTPPDWAHVVALYDRLAGFTASPVVLVNRAVAVGLAHGAEAGQRALDALAGDRRLAAYPWFHAARAHAALALGDHAAARGHYDVALEGALPSPQRDWLQRARASLPPPQ